MIDWPDGPGTAETETGRMDRVRRVGPPNDYAPKRFSALWMAPIMVSISSEVL